MNPLTLILKDRYFNRCYQNRSTFHSTFNAFKGNELSKMQTFSFVPWKSWVKWWLLICFCSTVLCSNKILYIPVLTFVNISQFTVPEHTVNTYCTSKCRTNSTSKALTTPDLAHSLVSFSCSGHRCIAAWVHFTVNMELLPCYTFSSCLCFLCTRAS